jgi:hypothetical protein
LFTSHGVAPLQIWRHPRVAIRGAETEGTVTAIMLENDGMQYRVVYWHDGVRRCEWLYGFELGQTVSA